MKISRRFELKTLSHAKFLQSEPLWYFETIPKSWNKDFHLTISTKNDSKFYCDTLDFQKMLLNRQYCSQECQKLTRGNLKYVLNDKKTLELVFEVIKYSNLSI